MHLSTAKETELFNNDIALEKKLITAEACIHHLWFSDVDYERLGTKIKWNPAIKTAEDRTAIWQALLNDKIDVIATDHAPHTIGEKNSSYFKAPSGGPLVQHSLTAMLEFYRQGKITLEKIVQKMCHNPSILFRVKDRGFIREGYFADLVLVNLDKPWLVNQKNILAHCGWSPFENYTFKSKVENTFVSGNLAYSNGQINKGNGLRLQFNN